jgi:hypothetical protein
MRCHVVCCRAVKENMGMVALEMMRLIVSSEMDERNKGSIDASLFSLSLFCHVHNAKLKVAVRARQRVDSEPNVRQLLLPFETTTYQHTSFSIILLLIAFIKSSSTNTSNNPSRCLSCLSWASTSSTTQPNSVIHTSLKSPSNVSNRCRKVGLCYICKFPHELMLYARSRMEINLRGLRNLVRLPHSSPTNFAQTNTSQ